MNADAVHHERFVAVPRVPLKERIAKWTVMLVIAGLLWWSWAPSEMYRWTSLITDAGNMAQFAKGFLSPNFRDWDIYLGDMIVTVQIAVWGTFLSIIFGIPFAILSSSNICPQWIVQPVRRLMDACRAINEIVFALLFVVAVGLGPFAGVMALFVHNLGVVAKLFSESVEAIDPRPVEGHTRHGCQQDAGNHLWGHPAGHTALDLVRALQVRDERALGNGAGYRRCGRHRAAAVGEHPQLRLC
jgi:ABC-type phosphate/phosphonate transport system permease subunit